MSNQLLGSRLFVDGTRRPIYEDARGQYVPDDEGEPIYGLWLIPEEECCDPPVIVDGRRHSER